MPKRTAATLGGVIAAILLIAGIAWASGVDDSPSGSTAPSTSTSLEDDGSSTSAGDLSTSSSVNGQTSTSVGDNASTSTTIDDNTSSTVDDNDDRDDNSGPGGGDDDSDDNSGPGGGDDDNSGPGGDDDDDAVAVADGIHAFDVAGVARVTVNVANGTLQLVDVEANAGWTAEIDEARADHIKVKFRNGESEAEFEAEMEHGGLEVEVETGS